MNESASERAQTTTAQKTTQLKHMLIDVDFAAKPKIKAMRAKFGQISRLWLIDVLCDLSRATGAKMERWAAIAIAQDLDIENGEELIQYCIERGILDAPTPDTISNIRVLEDQQALAKTQERWRNAKALREDSARIPQGTTEETARKSEHTEELNIEFELGGSGGILDADGEKAIGAWSQYLIKANRRPLDAISRDALCMRYAGRSKDLCRDVYAAIGNQWKNIRDASDLDAQTDAPKGKQMFGKPKETTTEAIARVMNFEIKTIGAK